MRYFKYIIILGIISHMTFISCQNNKTPRHKAPKDTLERSYEIIADSISYGVVIKNRDTTDTWQKKWLKNLDKQMVIDRVFEAVYEKELQPYDYFTGEKLSVKDIKKLERKKEFSRDKIGKIQFEETWNFDANNLRMVKAVKSIMLSYEVYREDSTFRGYKPAFKVYLDTPFQQKKQ
ncbi:MAG: hypothetical protein ACLFNJ_03740 [Bacteroidales bacterium]